MRHTSYTTILVILGMIGLAAFFAAPGAGAQTAPPTCFGMTPTIVGTEGNDDGVDAPAIEGTAGPDVIVGLGGHDEIDGNGGDDRICGNAGRDLIDRHAFGSAFGSDMLAGNGGRDCINGGHLDEPGNDVIRGGSENDPCLIGGAGNDFVAGGSGDDNISGDAGNDVLRGNYGNDNIEDPFSGTTENDRDILRGNPGDDDLVADDSDTIDTVDGGPHINGDTCTGNETAGGSDTFIECESVTTFPPFTP